jgi:hypothetical protein
MKKLLKMCLYGGLASVCALAFTPNVYSQEQETANETDLTPKFGVKGGINFANLYVNDVKDNHLKIGLNAGLFGKVPLARGLSIQPELLYSSKGSKVTYDNFAFGSGEYRFNLNYIETPLSMVINIARNFNIHGGAYAAYLVNANITDMNDDGTINDVDNMNAEKFNRFDYGLLAGLGLDIQNFTIGARYNYGLREIGKSGSFSGELLNNAKNSAVSLYIGVGF